MLTEHSTQVFLSSAVSHLPFTCCKLWFLQLSPC